MDVKFKGIGPGTCSWCRKEKDEVLALAFADGSFVGSYCFADFKKALRSKLEAVAPAKPDVKAAVGNGVGAAK